MAEKKKLTKEEALILRKKRAIAKKRKEQKALKEKEAGNSSKKEFLNDKERVLMATKLKENALATFAQFDFYKDGYKKTMGILIFNIIAFLIALSALTYSVFIYKAPPSFIGVNSKKQLLIDTPLSSPIYEDAEIINFATEAYRDITAYNYVNLKSNYFSGLKGHFTEKTLLKYKDAFLSTKEMTFVQENAFIVESTILKSVKIDQKASDKLSSDIGKRIWVVKMNSIKIYQNQKQYVRKNYSTTMKIMRVKNVLNEKGIAVQSFVDKEKK